MVALRVPRTAGLPAVAGDTAVTRILVGDALERLRELPDGSADCVITDPVWPNAPAGMFPGVDDPEKLLRDTLGALPAGVKRIVIVLRSDSDPRFLRAVPERWPFANASWLQYVMPGYFGRMLGGNEIAYAFGEPIPSAEGCRVIPSVAPKAQPGSRHPDGVVHPCPRVLVHMAWLVRWWSVEGETVLDPFAGSGTIGVAAQRLGRHAILIEKNPKYADAARARLAQDMPLLEAV